MRTKSGPWTVSTERIVEAVTIGLEALPVEWRLAIAAAVLEAHTETLDEPVMTMRCERGLVVVGLGADAREAGHRIGSAVAEVIGSIENAEAAKNKAEHGRTSLELLRARTELERRSPANGGS